MPIGFMITTGGFAVAAWSAVLDRRPRRSSPFRPIFVFGLWLNWPLIVFVFLVASTALAIAQTGHHSAWLWIGVAIAGGASAALMFLRRAAHRTGPTLERALDEGLGADWRDRVDAELAARLRRRPSLARVLLAPVIARRRGVRRIANIRYGPARRANRLDLYRDRSDHSGRPVLVHFHPLFGSKRIGTRYLFHRLAADGWLCVSANYRRAPDEDVRQAIAWVREHGPEHGADPAAVFVAGSSLGGGLAARAALTSNQPVAGLICLYGYHGGVAREQRRTHRRASSRTATATPSSSSRTPAASSSTCAPPPPSRSSTPSCPARNTASTSSAPGASTRSSTRSRPSPPTSERDRGT